MTKRLLILFALALPCFAQTPNRTQQIKTYYVDAITPGSDANPGTKASPFATVNHVTSIAPQGNAVVYVKYPDLSWQRLLMPYLNLKLLFLGEQGTDINKIYDVANGNHAAAHNITWLTSPVPKAFVCNGTNAYATFSPVIGNSDFNMYIAVSNDSGGTNPDYSEFLNAGSAAVIWQSVAGTPLLAVMDASSHGANLNGNDITPIPQNVTHIWANGRQGDTLYSYIADQFDISVTPGTMSPNPTVTTDGGMLCAYGSGGTPQFFAGGTFGAVAVYGTYGTDSDRTNRYYGLRQILFQLGVQVNQLLDPSLLTAGPVWLRQGEVLGNGAGGVTYAQEPAAIHEGNCKIVVSSSCFKMWFSSSNTTGVGYAESIDGISFTAYGSNPVITGVRYPSVIKVGSTYYVYASTSASLYQMNVYTSIDGENFTTLASDIVPHGSAGTINSVALYNSWVSYDGVLWRMLYDCTGTYPNETDFTNCVATSPDGVTWTVASVLPLGGFNPNSIGGPFFVYQDGRYWMWEQNENDIFRMTAQNFFGPWQFYPTTSTFPRGSTLDETAQTADPVMIELHQSCPGTSSADCTYMYYGAEQIAGGAGLNTIKLAVAPMTIRQIVQTTEGATTTTP